MNVFLVIILALVAAMAIFAPVPKVPLDWLRRPVRRQLMRGLAWGLAGVRFLFSPDLTLRQQFYAAFAQLNGLAPIAGAAVLERSALFMTKQPGGVYMAQDIPRTPGNVFYVDSGSGSDTAGNGRNPDSPVATIDYAVAL